MKQSLEVLKEFLSFPLNTTQPIFDKFLTLSGAEFFENKDDGSERFLFIPGTREDKVVLVAHADTYFDQYNNKPFEKKHYLVEAGDFIQGIDENKDNCPIGADDRAGCAILWLLQDIGHTLLITDGEEIGLKGSNWLVNHNLKIKDWLNSHQFFVQFDRRNARDFKTYTVGTPDFEAFISHHTNYTKPDNLARTDICALCTDLCGVNLSVGYYDEHTFNERINYKEWLHTLEVARRFLVKPLPRFSLKTQFTV
ncbi:MAG: hypothetical protein MUE53_02100 [Chitinophagales bacterium]|jgi:hypothetical protein|nr:hypothetical protein [Chitinophagales bacterium]